MRSFTCSEHIARTPDQLFAYMLDFRNAARWRSLVRRIDVVGDGPIREGTQILVTMDLMGKVRQALSEIWVYDPPRRVGFRNTANNVTGQFDYMLVPEREGTRITFTCDIRPHGLMWLILPFILRGHRARYVDQLARLKAAAESVGNSG